MNVKTTRTSTKFPGLTLTVEATTRGAIITFRHGVTFEAFSLVGGTASWIDCSDRFSMNANMVAHCRETARAYAAKLNSQGKAIAAWAA